MPDFSNSFDEINMPYSADAEQSVLGAILLDPSCINDDAMLELRPECFYVPQHRVIFTAVLSMSALSKPIDFVTILEELRATGEEESAGGKEYLAQLAQTVPSVKNVKAYIDVVLEKHYMRALIRAGRETVAEAQAAAAPAAALLDSAEQRLYEIREGRDTTGLVKISDVLKTETLERLNKLDNPETQKELRGIPTGISTIDSFIGGLHKSDLVIIGARPGMGKTSLILNIARNNAITSKAKVAFFSLEMTNDQLTQRILSSEAAVEAKKLRFGGLRSEEWDRIITASTELFDAELFLDQTSAITVSQMKSKLRRNRPDVVYIDYLQLISTNSRSENRVQQVSEMTRELKIMAKELNVPVVVCSQLARASEKRGGSHVPQLADLRESGSIEQDADIVMLLYRPNYYAITGEDVSASESEAQCIVAKNRHGETGVAYLHWEQTLARFTAGEPPENDYNE